MPKRSSLHKRGKELRKSHSKNLRSVAIKKKHEKAHLLKKRKRSALQGLTAYTNGARKCLYVGEGDFSFAASVAKMRWAKNKEAGELLVATTLDSHEKTCEKYPNTAAQNIDTLENEYKVPVLFNVDGTQLHLNQQLKQYAPFDIICFQFPHTGCGIKDTERNNEVHRDLIRKFLCSASQLLSKNGQIRVTVKRGEPYDNGWKVPKLCEGDLVYKTCEDFDPKNFDGYVHRRTLGAADTKDLDNVDITKLGCVTSIFGWKKKMQEAASVP